MSYDEDLWLDFIWKSGIHPFQQNQQLFKVFLFKGLTSYILRLPYLSAKEILLATAKWHCQEAVKEKRMQTLLSHFISFFPCIFSFSPLSFPIFVACLYFYLNIVQICINSMGKSRIEGCTNIFYCISCFIFCSFSL